MGVRQLGLGGWGGWGAERERGMQLERAGASSVEHVFECCYIVSHMLRFKIDLRLVLLIVHVTNIKKWIRHLCLEFYALYIPYKAAIHKRDPNQILLPK